MPTVHEACMQHKRLGFEAPEQQHAVLYLHREEIARLA